MMRSLVQKTSEPAKHRPLASQVVVPKNCATNRSQKLSRGKMEPESSPIAQELLDKMLFFFRFHAISLIQHFGHKLDFDDAPIANIQEALPNETVVKLMKTINTKTKYRYRCKIIYTNYQPLKQFFNSKSMNKSTLNNVRKNF
jgi:hypothetical protein